MTQPKRDWTDALAKVQDEGECRICGRTEGLEAAHIMGRSHDEPKLGKDGWPLKELYVDPDRICPLCAAWSGYGQGKWCHEMVDAHELDLLPFLTTSEQVRAVADAGSIETARRRLAPSAYKVAV